jgi:DNA-binding PadR family transcriptional regulator
MPRPLQTTHYALLALLGIRPWTAYELVGQMRRSVGAVWPRAQSNLYADLKRLAAEGWTEATVDPVGRGARTTHRITRKGRAGLRAWLAAPGAAPTFESEALLKLGFAPFTTKAAALAQIDVIAGHAQQRLELGARLAHEYVDGTGPMPERFHVNAVMWRFLWDFHHAMSDWATWARREVEAWPDTLDSPAMRARGLRVLRDALGGGRRM